METLAGRYTVSFTIHNTLFPLSYPHIGLSNIGWMHLGRAWSSGPILSPGPKAQLSPSEYRPFKHSVSRPVRHLNFRYVPLMSNVDSEFSYLNERILIKRLALSNFSYLLLMSLLGDGIYFFNLQVFISVTFMWSIDR